MKKTLLSILLSGLVFLNSPSSFGSFGTKVKVEANSTPTSEKALPTLEDAKASLEEFKKLSKKAKRDRFKEVKNVIKKFKADKKAGEDIDTNMLLLVLLAIFVPPLAVYLHEGETNNVFWINVLLTVLGIVLFGLGGVLFLGSIPGIIHALIVILG
jgi:uncharacterized membrane protein YqaE (UPF0057 family)